MRKLSEVDQEACERAIAIMRNSSAERREQLDRLLAEDGFDAAADLAVYHCQRELIRPRLWQPTPADIDPAEIEAIIARGDDGKAGRFVAAKLLRKMLRAGLSRFEPQPIEALAAVKTRRTPEPTAA
jgi:hypothetical protein